jgi:hypothetical protein
MMIGFALAESEHLKWEGRPAPRCYTFRHWRHSIFGMLFLGLACGWQILGMQMAEEHTAWLAWVPLPFLLIGIYLSVGHLIQARLEWNNVRYAITDQRLLAERGLFRRKVTSMSLVEMSYFRLDRQGENLGTLRVYQPGGQQMVLHCLEYPQQATRLLETAFSQGHEV